MREIIFRGKRKTDGRWVDGNLFIPDLGRAETQICIGTPTVRISYDVHPNTVGQYTGLTDKDGKRIFEGDIVKCFYVSRYRECEFISEVVFIDGSWFVHESEDCDIYLYNYENEGVGSLSEIKVIGNIHDNPELLEGLLNDTKESEREDD